MNIIAITWLITYVIGCLICWIDFKRYIFKVTSLGLDYSDVKTIIIILFSWIGVISIQMVKIIYNHYKQK